MPYFPTNSFEPFTLGFEMPPNETLLECLGPFILGKKYCILATESNNYCRGIGFVGDSKRYVMYAVI